MNHFIFDVIVIGAGQAGLTSSYYLKKHGLTHVVFEREKIANSWNTQRWQAFKLTSPRCFATLPGDKYEGDKPDDHAGAPEFVAYLNDYVFRNQLPVKENAKVVSLEFNEPRKLFSVTVNESGAINHYQSRQVIVASGAMNDMKIPPLAEKMPSSVKHIHAGQYRNPKQLPEGAVLVVGSAQSGSQIAEDLCKAGRTVYLATSQVGRIPGYYRSKDIYHWVIGAGFFGELIEKYGLKTDFASPPSVSLQSLAQQGVTLLGKLHKIESDNLHFGLTVSDNIKYADLFSKKVKEIIDEYIDKNNIPVPPPSFDADDAPDDKGCWDKAISTLNITDADIRWVVWASGFRYNYSYIKVPVLWDSGYPKHVNGITDMNGIYFPGLYGGSSIHGIKDNVEPIIERVRQYSTEVLKEVAY